MEMVHFVGLSGVFGLGMCFALLGSIGVKMMPRMGIDQGKFGSMISVFMFSCLVASLVIGAVMDSVGYQIVAVFGFAATALCIFIFARAKSAGPGMLACLLLGFAAMANNTVGNVLGTGEFQKFFDGDAAAANNLLNVFFGLGLFVTPFLISFLFQKVSYEKAVSVLGVIILIPLVFTFTAKYPAAAGFSVGDAFKLLAEPATIVAALVLFCYIALEASFSNWLAPFGKEVITANKPDAETGAVDASAQRMLSVFAIAMMAGRLFTSLSGIAAYGSFVIVGAAAVAVVIIAIMTVNKSTGLAWVLAAAAGFAFAPCFPMTVGVTFEKFGGGSGMLFGIIFAVGLLGAVIVPKAIGNVAKGSSVQKGMRLLIPACVVLIGLAVAMHYVKGPEKTPSAPAAPPKIDAPAVTVPS